MINHNWLLTVGCEQFSVLLSKESFLPTMVTVGYHLDFYGSADFIVEKAQYCIESDYVLATVKDCCDEPFDAETLSEFVNDRLEAGWILVRTSHDRSVETFDEWCQRFGIKQSLWIKQDKAVEPST